MGAPRAATRPTCDHCRLGYPFGIVLVGGADDPHAKAMALCTSCAVAWKSKGALPPMAANATSVAITVKDCALVLGTNKLRTMGFMAEARVVKAERRKVRLAFQQARVTLPEPSRAAPVFVEITRVSPSGVAMDDDNLAGACKHVRDEVAALLGVNDGDTSLVRFFPLQEQGPWACRIVIRVATGIAPGAAPTVRRLP